MVDIEPPGCDHVLDDPGTLDPLALAHQGLRTSISSDAIYIHLARADHPVHVDQALIRAQSRKLCRIHLLAANQARGVSLPQRNMTRSILIEQRVPEQHSALRNRRPMR